MSGSGMTYDGEKWHRNDESAESLARELRQVRRAHDLKARQLAREVKTVCELVNRVEHLIKGNPLEGLVEAEELLYEAQQLCADMLCGRSGLAPLG